MLSRVSTEVQLIWPELRNLSNHPATSPPYVAYMSEVYLIELFSCRIYISDLYELVRTGPRRLTLSAVDEGAAPLGDATLGK